MTTVVARPRSAGRGELIRRSGFGLALLFGALVFGLLAGDLAASGHSADVFALVVVLLPVALWKRPQLGPVILMSAAVLIEQVQGGATSSSNLFEAGVGDVSSAPPAPITSHIPLFDGIGSLHLEPADLLLLAVAAIYLVRTEPGTRNWPSSHVSRAMWAVLGCVGLGLVMGVAHHGQLRMAMMETRPYVYLAATYVLTSVLIRTRTALGAVLWAFVIAAAIKALQGIYVFFEVMSWHPRPDAVLGHEDAFTFGIYMILVAALWLFQIRGPLRKTATWLLPLVFMADLFNDRRAAWLLLGGGILTLAVIVYQTQPDRRHQLRRIALALVAFAAVYLPAYWNKTGTLAQPAVAIRSSISPNVRDSASDLYRVQENANLKYNIRQGGLLGKGFGVPIDYALPIVNISATDPYIDYIPHNGVLYQLMRMGILGAIAFWALLGTGIVAGCRLARSVDREIAVVGAVVAAGLVAYALEGAVDQGFFFYRIAFEMGILLGLAEAARRIQRTTGRPPASA